VPSYEDFESSFESFVLSDEGTRVLRARVKNESDDVGVGVGVAVVEGIDAAVGGGGGIEDDDGEGCEEEEEGNGVRNAEWNASDCNAAAACTAAIYDWTKLCGGGGCIHAPPEYDVEAASGGKAASVFDIKDINDWWCDGGDASAAVGSPQFASITVVVGEIFINPNGKIPFEFELEDDGDENCVFWSGVEEVVAEVDPNVAAVPWSCCCWEAKCGSNCCINEIVSINLQNGPIPYNLSNKENNNQK
jgi:hypothetical protein